MDIQDEGLLLGSKQDIAELLRDAARIFSFSFFFWEKLRNVKCKYAVEFIANTNKTGTGIFTASSYMMNHSTRNAYCGNLSTTHLIE